MSDFVTRDGRHHIPLSASEWKFLMGDDGTAHCRGCGKHIANINPDCPVCMLAVTAFMDEDPDYPALMEAARAL